MSKATDVQLVAVCDTDGKRAEQVARRFDVKRWYDDPAAVFSDSSVDAVVVATPDPLHVPLTTQALEAGKHVLVEKPLGLSRAECITLRDVLSRTGLKVQVGAMKRHDPGFEYAQTFVENHLGSLISCSAWYRASSFKNDWHATLAPPPVEPTSTTRVEEHKADRQRYYLATHGAHLFDGIRFLAGEISHVTARHTFSQETHVWQGVIELATGGLAHFDLVVSAPSAWSEGFAIYGDRGNIEIETHFPFFLRASSVRAFDASRREWSKPLFGDSDPFERQLEAFARAIANDLPTSPDLDDGIAAVEVIDAVSRSVLEGARMPIKR
jgi:predicted dehydrogenase